MIVKIAYIVVNIVFKNEYNLTDLVIQNLANLNYNKYIIYRLWNPYF